MQLTHVLVDGIYGSIDPIGSECDAMDQDQAVWLDEARVLLCPGLCEAFATVGLVQVIQVCPAGP